MSEISFGDNVRILRTELTVELGLADLVGNGRGFTTPSVTGIEAIGGYAQDKAFDVLVDQRNESFWLSPDLLEFVDHAPGTTITLDGVSKTWIRSETGEWEEIDTTSQTTTNGSEKG